MNKTNIFSERLSLALKLRKKKSVDVCNAIGISSALMSQYKRGVHEPNNEKAYAIAKFLNVDTAWLLGWSNEFNEFENKKNTIVKVPVYNSYESSASPIMYMNSLISINSKELAGYISYKDEQYATVYFVDRSKKNENKSKVLYTKNNQLLSGIYLDEKIITLENSKVDYANNENIKILGTILYSTEFYVIDGIFGEIIDD